MKQIFIYDPFATKDQMLNTNGRGILAASDARINWTKNGEYSANITVPKGAQGSDYFIKFAIVKIPTKHGKQLFRLESPEITLSGITAKAWHISYDLAKDVILNQKWTDKTGAEMLPLLLGAGTFENRFTGTSDIVTYNSLTAQRINILKSLINTDIDDSFLKRYSGEAERDNFTFNINARQGADRGTTVLYRKNLTGLSINVDTSSIVTRAIPTCFDENGAVLMLAELYVDAATIENYPFPIIKEIPFSDIKVGQKDSLGNVAYPTNAAARAEMVSRINALYAEGLGLPVLTVKFNFVELSSTVEYGYSALEEIYQGDTVTVSYDGVNYKLRVVQYTEDALTGRYDAITIGAVKNTIINTVASQLTATAAVAQQATSYAEAQAAFTDLVVNSTGFYATTIKQDDGSSIYYTHDQPLLTDSTVIYKKTGYTTSWSPDAGLHWYGMSADGNIIANILSTIGVDAQWIRSWMITIDAGTGGKIVMNPTTPMRITRPPVVEDGETEEVFIGGLVKVLDRLALIASILANSENPNVWAEIGEKIIDGNALKGLLMYRLDSLGAKYAASGWTLDAGDGFAIGDSTYERVMAHKTKTGLVHSNGVPVFLTDASGKTHIYDASGAEYNLGSPIFALTISLLVVGGGGGGGSGAAGAWEGGGGGAGGYIYVVDFGVSVTSYPIVVGLGGSSNANGENTRFGVTEALGGGYGGGNSGASGTGASGGGGRTMRAGANGTVGQGNAGGSDSSGSASGGGGGGGGVGGNGSSEHGGNGGAGLSNDISGSDTVYCEGGGGAGITAGTTVAGGGEGGNTGAGFAGIDGTGSGGGGGRSTGNYAGGRGGNGIVIVRYVTASFGACTGGTITTVGIYTIHTFTADGTFTVVGK